MTEEWRPIPGYEGRYEVSDQGRVNSIRSGKVLRPAPIRGYLAVHLYCSGKGKTKTIHRMVLEVFVGPAPEGHVVCHRDGNKVNNKLENLHWGTVSQNGFDAVRHGQHPQANKTHCPQGHPYIPENLRKGRKYRDCWPCDLERKKQKRRELSLLRAQKAAS